MALTHETRVQFPDGELFIFSFLQNETESKIIKAMSPEGFEPPTFGSGIRRAAVAPWALVEPSAA